MINFQKAAQVSKEVHEIVEKLYAEPEDTFYWSDVIHSIEDIDVAKGVIKELLKDVNSNTRR